MKKLISLSLSLLILSLFGCTQKEESDYPEEVHLDIDNVMTIQNNLFKVFNDLLQKTDTATTKDSVARLFRKNPDVVWAEPGITGISVEYKSGIKGGIFLGSRKKSFSINSSPIHAGIDTKVLKEVPITSLYHVPPTKRTILIAPIHDELSYVIDTLVEHLDKSLKRAGFEEPELDYNSNATVGKFAFLEHYGIIFLYSHGAPFLDKMKNIKEVYIKTGEKVNDNTNARYWRYINTGDIPLLIDHDGTFYFVSPSFIQKNNYFSKDSTLIYGGFCFSALGSWPQKMMESGVGGYFGFDWSVYSFKSDAFQYNLVRLMTDTNRYVPVTCGSFMNFFSDTSYYDFIDKKFVSLRYYGDRKMALWKPKNWKYNFHRGFFKLICMGNYTDSYGTSNSDFIGSWDVNGSFKNNVFSGSYSSIKGGNEGFDTLIVEFDITNHLIKKFRAVRNTHTPVGSGTMHGDVLITSSATLVPYTDIGLTKIFGKAAEKYIGTVKSETKSPTYTGKLNYLIFDDRSSLTLEFWE